MKTIALLEQPEIDAIFSEEGFALVLANGQQIIIKAEGEKAIMSDGKIQVVMVAVEGSNEIVREAMWTFKESINSFGNGRPAPREIPPAADPIRPIAATVAEKAPIDLVHAAARSPRVQPSRSKPTKSGSLECEKCGKICKSAQGLSKHERTCTGVVKERRANPSLDCPECGRICATTRALGFHRSTMHGMRGKFVRDKAAPKYPCEVDDCKEAFGLKAERKDHWRTVHGL